MGAPRGNIKKIYDDLLANQRYEEAYLTLMDILSVVKDPSLKADGLADLAEKYRDAGRDEEAVLLMKRASDTNPEAIGYREIYNMWKKNVDPRQSKGTYCPYCNSSIEQNQALCPNCLRRMVICSQCQYPNKIFHQQCFSCGNSLSPYDVWIPRKNEYRSSYVPRQGKITTSNKWTYSFHTPIRNEFLPNVPSPVIAGDIIICPHPDDLGVIKSLVGLKIETGEVLWEWHTGDLLTYPSAPIPIGSFLYLFSRKTLRRRFIDMETAESFSICSHQTLAPQGYLQPLAFSYQDMTFIILVLDKALFVYKIPLHEYEFIEVALKKENDKIAGIAWDGKSVAIISRKGEILSLRDELHIQSLKILEGEVEICSPPCVFEKDIYFEFMYRNEFRRRICAFNLEERKLVTAELEHEEGCNPEHLHWQIPFLTHKNGILISSDLYSRIYIGRREGDVIITIPKELEITNGITNIFQEFSGLLGSYLISSVGNLFFCVDIQSPDEKSWGHLDSPVIAQPAISQKGLLFFLCTRGLHCYEII